ncbi:hypothetical protein K490DRAFT_36432 [Saccharata proteae CBS 121410]|uniref:Zn(2)-C6 fungal-type domain-containing protein n=1 Tax=Saccharata proteae CBS 121410 TaxID=1314787 RepID=A0A9P4M1Q6_9PEZI|nr:hypothetical protein K490DRAFT_36432 [Saccharata proteae CBS 121410]
MAATSPTNGGHFAGFSNSPQTPHHGLKRSQSSVGFDSSPGSLHEDDDTQSHSKKNSQKRACNECRQQKLKCDVVQDPFEACSRCKKQALTCVVSANFKRVGKRSRHAEMEREALDLKTKVKNLEQLNYDLKQQMASFGINPPGSVPRHNSNGYGGGPHDEAVSSLVSLKQGLGSSAFDSNIRNAAYHLGDAYISTEQVSELFNDYFRHYHDYLPLLDPAQPIETYMTQSKFLFWTIIAVAARHYKKDNILEKMTSAYKALVWSTISEVPQTYHVVKALCLLCTWPLPSSSTTIDETFVLSGVMMQTAMHHGLHQPSHAQDFSRTHVQLRDEDIKDRLTTWAVCNIVAHCVSVASGQPSTTLFDSALSFEHDHMERLPPDLVNHVMLERSAAKITKALYSDSGSSGDKSLRGPRFSGTFNNEWHIHAGDLLMHATDLDMLHLRAVRLNLQLYAFFSKQEHGWHSDLLNLLLSTNDFLSSVWLLQDTSSIKFTTNYIAQMMVAAGFTLHRLLNSNFVSAITENHQVKSKQNFSKLISAIRDTSVRTNDLPQRLAEVLAQLWKAAGSGHSNADMDSFRFGPDSTVDVSIHLKVRCRMSMSVVFDSLWNWRDQFRGRGPTGNLDNAVQNPTDPETSSSTTPAPPNRASHTNDPTVSLDPNLPTLSLPTMGGNLNLANSMTQDMGPFADYTSDFFDPMSSILNDPVFFNGNSFPF